MATDSISAKPQADIFRSKVNTDIWGLKSASSSFVAEVTLQTASEGNLPLTNIGNNRPVSVSRAASSQKITDKNDTTIFPALPEIKRSSTAKTSSFSLLSELFYNENDASVDSLPNAGKEGATDYMSSGNKYVQKSSGDKNSVSDLPSKPTHHKATVKKKHGRSHKKSNQSPVLKRSQTGYQSHPKSADGAKVKYTVKTQGNVTTDLNILTAQCQAVKIHQHFQSNNKILPVNNFFKSKQLSIISKPKDQPHQHTVSKSTNHVKDSQHFNGGSSRKYSSSSPVQVTRRSFTQTEKVYLQRVTKVYLSEKHSGVINEDGKEFPCAPPATPTPEQLRRYEYVPSLNDVRSQRAVRQKLQVMERKEQHKEEKRREEQARIDRHLQKDRESELRRRQRQEIYALNKIMTELEHKRFLEFCKQKGITT